MPSNQISSSCINLISCLSEHSLSFILLCWLLILLCLVTFNWWIHVIWFLFNWLLHASSLHHLLLLLLLLHFHLLIHLKINVLLRNILHTVTTRSGSTAALKDTSLILTSRHFGNLPFILKMWAPIIIKLLFLQNCLLVKQTFCECVIFLFNSFGFSFSHTHIQTCWTL